MEGLAKLADRAEIAANDWSLTPPVAMSAPRPKRKMRASTSQRPLRNIHAELDDLNHAELDDLNAEAVALAATIRKRASMIWGYEHGVEEAGRGAMTEEIRWQYRLRNFSRAFTLLREALEGEVEALSQLEREGVIQRFEYTFELAWNLLKDRLEYDGIVLPTVTPRQVIRQAFQARLIHDGDAWIDMLTDRNLMSHTYDFAKFEAVIRKIQRHYLRILGELYERLSLEAMEP